jgi:hypothetical protein
MNNVSLSQPYIGPYMALTVFLNNTFELWNGISFTNSQLRSRNSLCHCCTCYLDVFVIVFILLSDTVLREHTEINIAVQPCCLFERITSIRKRLLNLTTRQSK